MTDDGGLPATTKGGQDSGLDEFRALVQAAFGQALDSGKPDWNEMTSAVLKNRLLNLTDRQFSQIRYGSPSFINLVRRVPDLIDIIDDHPPFRLRIKVPIAEQAGPGPALENLPQPNAGAFFEAVAQGDWRRVRVRDDLWRAIIDYASHKIYVLDPDTRSARPRKATDAELPVLPTVSAEDLASWRQEFIESLAETTKEKFNTELHAWLDGRGRQSDLPRPVRGSWAEFIKRRVGTILLDWFKTHGEPPPSDMMSTSQGYSLTRAEAIDEVLRTRQLQDLIIRAVRAMTYEELAQIPLPASVLLHVTTGRPNYDA